jgi:hypothetical protein
MDQETISDILAQILSTNDKWKLEVERNILLQNTLEDLFTDELFQILLENRVIPKYHDTLIPHFRAVELICSFREFARQAKEDGADQAAVDRELEDLMLKISDKWGTAASFEARQDLKEGIEEAGKIAWRYKEDPQFSTRVDKFRLLVLPLCLKGDGSGSCQILVLENIRQSRDAWARK